MVEGKTDALRITHQFEGTERGILRAQYNSVVVSLMARAISAATITTSVHPDATQHTGTTLAQPTSSSGGDGGEKH